MERPLRGAYTGRGKIIFFGPAVGRDLELSNAKTLEDDLAETGIRATK